MNSMSKSVPPSPAVCKGWLPKESPVSSSLSLFPLQTFWGIWSILWIGETTLMMVICMAYDTQLLVKAVIFGFISAREE